MLIATLCNSLAPPNESFSPENGYRMYASLRVHLCGSPSLALSPLQTLAGRPRQGCFYPNALSRAVFRPQHLQCTGESSCKVYKLS